MFERFTNKAREAVVRAQEESRGLDHNFIGTEHLLLGVLAGDNMAVKALTAVGVDIAALRAKLIEGAGRGDPNRRPSGHIPFTRRAKKVMELSLREALTLETNYIGTEHMLLALIREGEGAAAKVLAEFADGLAIRSAVIDLLPTSDEGDRVPRRRRFVRARATGGGVEFGVSADTEQTGAVDATLDEAKKLAGDSPLGSQHLLLGMLATGDTAAAKALADLGVDLDALREKLSSVDVAGTSDATPEETGGRSITIALEIEGVKRLVLSSDSPDLVDRLSGALSAIGLDPGDKLSGGQDFTASFGSIWESIRDGLIDVKRRADSTTSEPEQPSTDDDPPARAVA